MQQSIILQNFKIETYSISRRRKSLWAIFGSSYLKNKLQALGAFGHEVILVIFLAIEGPVLAVHAQFSGKSSSTWVCHLHFPVFHCTHLRSALQVMQAKHPSSWYKVSLAFMALPVISSLHLPHFWLSSTAASPILMNLFSFARGLQILVSYLSCKNEILLKNRKFSVTSSLHSI